MSMVGDGVESCILEAMGQGVTFKEWSLFNEDARLSSGAACDVSSPADRQLVILRRCVQVWRSSASVQTEQLLARKDARTLFPNLLDSPNKISPCKPGWCLWYSRDLGVSDTLDL